MPTPKQTMNLANQFLIAMPGLNDPSFERSLIYICHHDDEGAMGLIINQETDAQLDELLEQLEISSEQDLPQKVLHGGPVRQEQGFILHSTDNGPYPKSDIICEEVALSGSLEVLEHIATGDGPKKFLVSLGYAGWAPDQLEDEIQSNSWLTAPVDVDILFGVPSHLKWKKAVASLGFDPNTLQSTAGHA
ncbi:YqgE/AlgH family protein [Pseudoteredinibacter isoporae]|uniref:YqgE/AlgH family protein n=1 Tax=Pseudoteredinibacter isoporae TaxID=570281 RepID=UPI0031072EFE